MIFSNRQFLFDEFTESLERNECICELDHDTERQ